MHPLLRFLERDPVAAAVHAVFALSPAQRRAFEAEVARVAGPAPLWTVTIEERSA